MGRMLGFEPPQPQCIAHNKYRVETHGERTQYKTKGVIKQPGCKWDSNSIIEECS